MDFDKKYSEYLDWRLMYLQSLQCNTTKDFDSKYFQKITLNELIQFRQNFIEKSRFFPTAKEITIQTMNTIIAQKKEQSREDMINDILSSEK